MIARIRKSLSIHWGKRLFILYGPGLEDAFIDEQLQELEIEKTLVAELKANGFDRIVFSSPHNSIYFHDEKSRQLTSPSNKQVEIPNEGQMQRLDNGPFNTLMLFSPQNNRNLDNSYSSMGDMGTIRFLNTVMNSCDYRTAVVIVQAEALLCQFDDPRILSGLIGSWARLPSTNQNACFFLFSADTIDQLTDVSNQLPIPEIRSAIQQNENITNRHAVVKIGAPSNDEIKRLITKMRREANFKVDIKDFDQIIGFMEIESISLRQWINKVKEISLLNMETTRQRKWFSGTIGGEKSPEDQLNELVGLDNIKKRLLETSAWLALKNGMSTEKPTMHMIFCGNPGTGKTTVARLFGELLRNIGVLNRGHLVEATGSELIGDVVGSTAIKTRRIIDSAMDGVLFIDEAYTLNEPDRGGYGQEAIETILPRLDSDRTRLVVILAGYPTRMKKFLESNPGLSRRFPAENIINFPDYTPAELGEILSRMLQKFDITTNQSSDNALIQVIEGLYQGRDENFGNAGEIRNLAEAMDRRRAARLYSQKSIRSDMICEPLLVEDIPPSYSIHLESELPHIETIFQELDSLIGLGEVKEYFEKLITRLRYEKLRSSKYPSLKSSPLLQHLVFTGNPGTGKTTVARLVGKMYQSIGLLKKGHCVEVSRADLIA